MPGEKRMETLDQKYKKSREKWDKLHFDSQQGRAGEDPYPTAAGSLRTPLYATKSYAYNSLSELLKNHYNYSRTENPTLYALDQKLATLHKGEAAVSVASGMAAVHLACSSILQKRVERIRPKKIKDLLPQNDPDNIPTEGSNYLFYLKNIGERKIPTTNDTFTIFIEGDLVVKANYNFSDTSIKKEEHTTLYVNNAEISTGDQTLRVVGPQDIVDEFTFTI